MKTLYIGHFNYYGEIHTIYRHASSTKQAFRQMIRVLARRLNKMHTPLAHYFWDSDKYKIERSQDASN